MVNRTKKVKYRILLFCIFCFAFIGCDRATKNLAKIHLMDKEPLSFLHNTFRLEYVENTGAFLSFGDTWPKAVSFWVFSLFPLAFMSILFIYVMRKSSQMSLWRMMPFAFIISGGIGNIIDRILFDRHVTDFMNVGINNLRTGIFNFADVYVMIGVFMLFSFRTVKRSP
ncbi:MAG: signal peptidase II [Bacteroidetes bacterium]|nr:signal peptidase II [Bacteroidota bacterium]